MTNTEIRARLESLAEPAYQAFNSKLIPGHAHVLGVRLPHLRRLAKELARGDYPQYLQGARDDSYEETLLQGMVIGYAKAGPDMLLPLIASFVEKLDNWSTCDSFCGGLKIARAYPDRLWDFVLPYLSDPRTYPLRFGIVMLLIYYIDDKHIENVLALLDSVRHEDYYVRMAVAWAVSMCYVAFPERTEAYLHACALDTWTFNKALQKVIESRQVNDEIRARMRAMKRKGR